MFEMSLALITVGGDLAATMFEMANRRANGRGAPGCRECPGA
jgi:hypothetical protein